MKPGSEPQNIREFLDGLASRSRYSFSTAEASLPKTCCENVALCQTSAHCTPAVGRGLSPVHGYTIMSLTTTHYAPTQNPEILSMQAAEMAEHLSEWMQGRGLEPSQVALLYQGMSGIVFATALMLEMYRRYSAKLCMVYVRKSSEESHGVPAEYSHHNGTMPEWYVFVDDFVSLGKTRTAAFEGLRYVPLPPNVSHAQLMSSSECVTEL